MPGTASVLFPCGGTMSAERCEIHRNESGVDLRRRAAAVVPAVRLPVIAPDQQYCILMLAAWPRRRHQSRDQLCPAN